MFFPLFVSCFLESRCDDFLLPWFDMKKLQKSQRIYSYIIVALLRAKRATWIPGLSRLLPAGQQSAAQGSPACSKPCKQPAETNRTLYNRRHLNSSCFPNPTTITLTEWSSGQADACHQHTACRYNMFKIVVCWFLFLCVGACCCCSVAHQASADLPDLLARVKQLMQHKDFTLKNPNRLRSVVSSFASCQNKFHAKDGSGYEFMGDMVLEVDQLNPQVSAGRCWYAALPPLLSFTVPAPIHSDLWIKLLLFVHTRGAIRITVRIGL